MDKKLIKVLLIISGIVSLVSGFGYILEKLNYFTDNFQFLSILIVSLIVFVVILVFLLQISKTNFNLEDQKTTYVVKILNNKGDAYIKRKTTFKVNKGIVIKREHSIFSDGAPMNQNDLKLKAWDDFGNTLFCKFVLDKPTTKKFEIYFHHPISKKQNYIYTYQCFWNKLFDLKNDYYLLMDTSIRPEFHLILPKESKLQYIDATEIFRDGINKELKVNPNGQEVEDNIYIKHKYFINRTEKHTQVKFEWRVEDTLNDNN